MSYSRHLLLQKHLQFRDYGTDNRMGGVRAESLASHPELELGEHCLGGGGGEFQARCEPAWAPALRVANSPSGSGQVTCLPALVSLHFKMGKKWSYSSLLRGD